MALVLSESFVTGIPAGFASSQVSSGTLTATYNAAQQAVDISKDSSQGAWRLDTVPSKASLRVVMDIEHTGTFPDSAASLGVYWKGDANVYAVGAFVYPNQANFALFGGASFAPIDVMTTYVSNPGGAPAVPSTGRHTYEFGCTAPDTLGIRQFYVKIDGTLAAAVIVYNAIGKTDLIKPYIGIRNTAFRLHSVDVYDSVAALVTVVPKAFKTNSFVVTSPVFNTAPALKLVLSNAKLFDMQFGGKGRIVGTVKVKATPNRAVRRRVWLLRERDAQVIRETWSDPVTGEYRFEYIDQTQRYTVLTYDYEHNFRSVVADNLQPELM